MLVYVITFILSLFMFWLALVFRNKQKIIFIIFSIVAIFIPCYIAGVRDLSIGTDVKVYIEPLFRVAKYFNSFSSYINNTGSEVRDLLYLLLTFFCSKNSSNIFLLFFMTQLLTITPIYITLLKRNDNSGSVILGIFIYFMFFYNLSFNMARQSIAISFSLLSMSYFIDNKKYKALILFLISYLFHSSCIVMIGAYILYNLFKKNDNNKKVLFGYKAIIIVFISTLVVFLPQLINILIKIGLLNNNHFSNILKRFAGFDFNVARTFFYIMFFVVMYINKDFLIKKIKNFNYYYFLSLISIIILQLGAVIRYSERIGYSYLFISLFYVMPSLAPNFKLKTIKKTELFNFIIIVCLFIFYWLFWTVYKGSNETYPFLFR